MATLRAVVLDHHKKSDKSYNVKIRISQKGKSVYLPTSLFVGAAHIDRNGKLKSAYVDRYVAPVLSRYRDYLTDEVSRLYSAARIKEFLIAKDRPVQQVEDIDFIEFCNSYIDRLRKQGRNTSASPLVTVTNSLNDYFKGRLSPDMLTSRTLTEYEDYLRTDRSMKRVNQYGNTVKIDRAGLTDAGVFKHMSNLRQLFNACKIKYNDDDAGVIIVRNNPFARYKIKPTRNRRVRHVSVDELISLFKTEPTTCRQQLAKDMYIISFCMCGMNSVDIFKNDLIVRDGRISYNRSKTKGKRDDEAFFSIQVPEIVVPLLDKYRGKLSKRYANELNFNKALNKGLSQLGLSSTFYGARHTFATIARNDCGFSKDDVAEALNHVDHGLKVTDGYIAKDWSVVDRVQSAVLQFFFNQLD